MQMTTTAEVDLSAIRDNVRAIRARVGPRVKIIPAVKAGAYAHGAVVVSRECVAAGVDVLGVASIDEAIELRQGGIKSDILILGCQLPEAAPEIIHWDIMATACDRSFAEALSQEAVRQGKVARIHVKVDTGMGRIGVAPDQAVDFVRELMGMPGLRIAGIFTHFTASDEPDPDFTQMQIGTFKKVSAGIRTLGLKAFTAHASNSAGILRCPESDFDGVRPGIVLYGLYPSEHVPASIPVREALTLKTHIVFLRASEQGSPVSYGRTHILKRKSLVATIPVGYEDGYPRSLSGIGEVAVRGARVPVLGRVCMDQTMIDVTDVPGIQIGDEVTLYGGGYDYLSISRIAKMLGTIPHDILCGIGTRVPRVYLNGAGN